METEKPKEIEVQGFKFNLEGTKAMGKKAFIDSWNGQKKPKKDDNGKEITVKGRLGRFDPEKAWDTLFPPKK